jgi:hypothetical protein
MRKSPVALATARSIFVAFGALFLASASVACGGAPKPEPEIVSSANHGLYAAAYGSSLSATIQDFNDRQGVARKAMESWNAYPGQLKDPPTQRVLDVITAADEDGRSQQYVERIRLVDGAHTFFETEKDELNKHVGGAAQFLVKKKGCDVEVAGTVNATLKETIEKQLQKELRDSSEAQRLIERDRAALGKESAAELEKQADSIAFVSYLVHIELVEDKVRIKRMVAEVEEVKKAVDAAIEGERRAQQDKGATAAEKKASDERIAALDKSKALIDPAAQQANALVPHIDEQLQKLTDENAQALKTLRARFEDKGKH